MDFQDPETKERLGELIILPTGGPPPMLIASAAMNRLLRQVQRAALSDFEVLVQGENGVGKEHIATAVHCLGERRDGPLVDVNCACLPGELLESELFGHVKGAFTNAISSKPGLFQLANKGTLFLDEISELPLALQPKLLRVLQERKIRPVGGVQNIPVDVRFVASTNQDLSALVAQNKFREDLYYRLNMLTFTVPPLRERPEEILPLSRYFVVTIGRGLEHKQFSQEAKEKLLAHSWPGNVRELKHVVEAALLMGEETEITADDLRIDTLFAPQKISPAGSVIEEVSRDSHGIPNSMAAVAAEAEKRQILAVLKECGGNRTAAAKILSVSRHTLHKRLLEYDITAS